MMVKLFKRNVEYTTATGEVKTATNYFLQCGDVLVPIEVKFFADRVTGEDKNYRTRRTLMSAFAEELPERKKEMPTETKPVESAIDDPTA